MELPEMICLGLLIGVAAYGYVVILVEQAEQAELANIGTASSAANDDQQRIWDAALSGRVETVKTMMRVHRVPRNTVHHVLKHHLVLDIAAVCTDDPELDRKLCEVLRVLADKGWQLDVQSLQTGENALHILIRQSGRTSKRISFFVDAVVHPYSKLSNMLATVDREGWKPEDCRQMFHRRRVTRTLGEMRRAIRHARRADAASQEPVGAVELLQRLWDTALAGDSETLDGLLQRYSIQADTIHPVSQAHLVLDIASVTIVLTRSQDLDVKLRRVLRVLADADWKLDVRDSAGQNAFHILANQAFGDKLGSNGRAIEERLQFFESMVLQEPLRLGGMLGVVDSTGSMPEQRAEQVRSPLLSKRLEKVRIAAEMAHRRPPAVGLFAQQAAQEPPAGGGGAVDDELLRWWAGA